MRNFFFSIIISFLSLTIISCGQTTEEGVASAVSSTNDAVNSTTGAVDDSLFGGTDGSGVACPSVGTFQKNFSARTWCHPQERHKTCLSVRISNSF